MDPLPQNTTSIDQLLSQLRSQYVSNHITPLWESKGAAFAQSREKAHRWAWADMRPVMFETTKLALPGILERRVMLFANPTLIESGTDATSGLINAGLQALLPGEVARAHRHSMHALRFVLEGSGAETVVEGKPCSMEPGDLIITPGWTWHEHRNPQGKPTVWVDILDGALQQLLGTAAFQPGPVKEYAQTTADAAFASAAFVPMGVNANTQPYSPLFRYPWEEAKKAVLNAPVSSDGSRSVRYANPLNGGPVLPTIDCYLRQIEPGAATRLERTSASSVCVVMAGSGETSAGDVTFSWGPFDVFSVPQGAWVQHRCNNGPAIIFSASNREVYRAIGLLSEEHKT